MECGSGRLPQRRRDLRLNQLCRAEVACAIAVIMPGGIDVRVEMEDILAGGRFIGLGQIDTVAAQTYFHRSRQQDRLAHDGRAEVVAEGVYIAHMLLRHDERVLLQ